VWGITLVAAALALGLTAFAFAIGAPTFAVPIVIVGIAVIGAVDYHRRRRRDRETLVSK
jgi:hypothetical protein